MLHLAQVEKERTLGQIALRLLACQQPDNTWAILVEKNVFLTTDTILNSSFNHTFNEGVLVLVEITDRQEILSIQEATNWVLKLVEQYLTKGITLDFLQQECEKAEQCRQILTLQSQELSRRAIEIEARREQIQTLEEKLHREKQLLEMMAAKLKAQPN
ncbi:hypothetical protein [Phormidium nigroviride]